ncbi:MAG: Ig-like domain-containing protein [Clostridiales bacterium]|nr:Ig-like domain-containing protein [Clostridiales bacterium]
MNKHTIKKIIALCVAGAGMGVFALSGCADKGNGHTHTWGTKYYQDGENGHYRKSICVDHATVDEEVHAHDGGDVCSKCGYVSSGVLSVAIYGDSEVEVGGKIQLNAVVTPNSATNKTVTWSIESGAEFAEIDADGVLTGTARGTVTVKAVAGGIIDTYEVEVVEASSETVHVTGVTLDKGTLTITLDGADQMLTASVKPSNAKNKTYSWSSDNTAVATVTNGLVHPVSAGTANITVTTNDGNHTATCAVTVKAAQPGKDPTTAGGALETPENPVITPVQGGPVITKASLGELESAYVEWTAADSADWYNVYVSPENADSWTKLDAPLVRQYNGYYRADAVGLAAGTYDMKVVPVNNAGAEAEQYAATAEKITVYAHDRSGFGFVNGSSSGAYNEDGTIKSNAIIVYVTEETKDTVSVTVKVNEGKKNETTETFVGVQNIIAGMKSQKKISVPVCVRIVGNITDVANMPKGDLYVDGASELTIEGIGADATINGFGIVIKNSSNLEVRNLGYMNCNSKEGDDVGLQQGNDHIWVHNCDFFYGDAGSDADQVKGDGALDTKKSTYVTHSYNHFWDNGKCNLQGMKSETTENYITYHHNWYDHSDSRHPRIRTCTVHIYNNYFDGNAKYCVGVTMGASAFVENNYFRSTAQLKPMLSSGQGTDALGEGTFSGEAGGIIKSYNNKYDCSASNLKLMTQNDTDINNIDCYEVTSRTEKVPASVKTKSGGTTYSNFDTAENMYSYAVDTPDQAKEKVERYAGRVDGGDLKYTFNNATEDENYAVIAELKAALVAYNDKIVKIGKDD